MTRPGFNAASIPCQFKFLHYIIYDMLYGLPLQCHIGITLPLELQNEMIIIIDL